MSHQELHHLALAEAAHYTLSLPAAEATYAHLVLTALELEVPVTGYPTHETLALLAIHAGLSAHVAARVYAEVRRRLAGYRSESKEFAHAIQR